MAVKGLMTPEPKLYQSYVIYNYLQNWCWQHTSGTFSKIHVKLEKNLKQNDW